MQLINQTVVPAELLISEHGTTAAGAKKRAGLLVAKATFEVHADGSLELVSDDPYPVLFDEEPTPLGILPRDVRPPGGSEFEVMALAAAYSPNGAPVERRTVTMWVADRRDDLCVFGDRVWVSGGGSTAMSAPAPFTRMPLMWERAFGGTAIAWLDAHTPLPVSHPYNGLGRGFDPAPMIEGLGTALSCPDTFPRTDYQRALPNVERIDAQITSPDDEPTPACWAPMPLELGLRLKPAADAAMAAPDERSREEAVKTAGDRISFALPRWRLPSAPAPRAPIGLTGCRPMDRPFAFRWPRLSVCADYVLGDKRGVRKLVPTALVLLPEEQRFLVTYRDMFAFLLEEDGLERSMRLRLEE